MLEVRNISFRYEERKVIDNVNFTIDKGQNIFLIGESGCGKSTLLKLIYGLYNLDEGIISWNRNLIWGPKFNLVPGSDFMKYLTQDFDLMPYTTVRENIGKFLSNIYKDKKEKRIQELLEMIEMTDFAEVKVKYLSGGQQQRVALARALADESELLLLDEPFSQMDSLRRNILQRNLFSYLKKKGISCIVATHDCVEALSYGDQIMVMQKGRVLFQKHPTLVYQNPRTKYVASLFGEVNEIPVSALMPDENIEKMILIYTHELYLTEISDLAVIVRKSYFKGSHYLIEGIYKSKVIFFDCSFPISEGEIIYLKADEKLILSRIQ